MSTEIPKAAVEAFQESAFGRGTAINERVLRSALAAALPHLAPAIRNEEREKVRAAIEKLRARHQHYYDKLGNRGVPNARKEEVGSAIKGLDELLKSLPLDAPEEPAKDTNVAERLLSDEAAEMVAKRLWACRIADGEGLPRWENLTDAERALKLDNGRNLLLAAVQPTEKEPCEKCGGDGTEDNSCRVCNPSYWPQIDEEQLSMEKTAKLLQKWARQKRRDAKDFVGPEKEQARWVATGYDGAADLLISMLPPIPPVAPKEDSDEGEVASTPSTRTRATRKQLEEEIGRSLATGLLRDLETAERRGEQAETERDSRLTKEQCREKLLSEEKIEGDLSFLDILFGAEWGSEERDVLVEALDAAFGEDSAHA